VTDELNDLTSPAAPDDNALSAITAERDDLKDRLLRLTADFDNHRKRVERERRELSEAAAADLIRDVLPILDDLERAIAAASAEGESALLAGVRLTHKQLLEQLRRRGVESIDAVGQPFDPQVHEAVGSVPAAGRPDGEVVEEFRKGYRLGGKLLRASMVQVAKA
jgi:molecular chaperone GrpE